MKNALSKIPIILFFVMMGLVLVSSCNKQDNNNDVVLNSPPNALFVIAPDSGSTATIFTFDATLCSDLEDSLSELSIRWDWEGDGTWDTDWSTNKIFHKQFVDSGTYAVTLAVIDNEFLTDTHTIDLPVSIEPDVYPSLSFVVDEEFVYCDTLLNVNAEFKIGVIALSNNNTNIPLTHFELKQAVGDYSEILFDTSFYSNSYYDNWNFTAPQGESVFDLVFSINDEENRLTRDTINLTVHL